MSLVGVHDDDGVAVVTIDRPPANAMDPTLLAAGLEALDGLRAIPAPSAVVLTGAGEFFSGGADLRVVPALTGAEQATMARDINALFTGWYELARPVVCAVNGHAVAGGLVLALCGDYRVGPTSGRFGLTEVKVGIPYPSAAMAVVMAELGAHARRVVLRGDLFDSATARSFGVFDEIVADGRVLSRAMEVAREMAALPPATFELTKRRLRAGVIDAQRGRFGGGAAAPGALAEARDAASRVLDDR